MGSIVNGDVELLAAETLLHLKAVPGVRDGREDGDAVRIRADAADALGAADHDGRGRAGEPVYMGTSLERRRLALGELAVYIRLEHADLGLVVQARGRGLEEILERAVAVAQQALGQDQPALRLREDTAVLLGVRIEDVHERAVEEVLLVGRLEELGAIGRVQDAVDALHGLVSLLGGREAGDDRPALRVEPHVRLGILLGADDLAGVADVADETVLVPALLEGVAQLLLHVVEVGDVVGVALVLGHGAHHVHRVIELERHERGLALRAHAQAVVPVRMQTGGHVMVAHVLHGEADRALEVVIDRVLAAVRIDDRLVQERLVAALADVLHDGREEPERIVCTVGRMAGLLDVIRVVRGVLVAGVMGELDQRQTAAVVDLCGQHEADLLGRHLGVEVDDALDVLHGVAVAVAVAQAAVHERCRTRPDEGDEALVRVPDVHHVVELVRGRLDLEVAELAVPEGLEVGDLGVDGAGCLVALHDRGGLGVVLLTEQIDQLTGLAGGEGDLGAQGAAGVGVEIHRIIALALLDHDRRGVGAVRPNELVEVAAAVEHVSTDHAEEALAVVGAVGPLAGILVDVLEDLVPLALGAGDEERVLEVDLILLIVVVVGELHEAEHGERAGLVGGIGDLGAPYLIGLAGGDVVGRLGRDAGIGGGHDGIRRAVAALALVLVEGLADGLPGGRPEVAALGVAQVDVSARQRHHGIEAESEVASIRAGLHEAVACGVIGDDGTVGGVAEVVDPGRGGIRAGDDIFLVGKVEVAVLHDGLSFMVNFSGGRVARYTYFYCTISSCVLQAFFHRMVTFFRHDEKRPLGSWCKGGASYYVLGCRTGRLTPRCRTSW